jgi:hypothetical protein
MPLDFDFIHPKNSSVKSQFSTDQTVREFLQEVARTGLKLTFNVRLHRISEFTGQVPGIAT